MRDGRCDFNEFDCNIAESIPLCLPFEVVRDCIADCPNGEDESLFNLNKSDRIICVVSRMWIQSDFM